MDNINKAKGLLIQAHEILAKKGKKQKVKNKDIDKPYMGKR